MTMTVYHYKITYIDGHVDKFNKFTEQMDLMEITKLPWWFLKCGEWNMLIRTDQIATIREEIEELSEFDSLDFALTRTNWSKSKTMELLGISDRTLYRRMKNHHFNTGALKP